MIIYDYLIHVTVSAGMERLKLQTIDDTGERSTDTEETDGNAEMIAQEIVDTYCLLDVLGADSAKKKCMSRCWFRSFAFIHSHPFEIETVPK